MNTAKTKTRKYAGINVSPEVYERLTRLQLKEASKSNERLTAGQFVSKLLDVWERHDGI